MLNSTFMKMTSSPYVLSYQTNSSQANITENKNKFHDDFSIQFHKENQTNFISYSSNIPEVSTLHANITENINFIFNSSLIDQNDLFISNLSEFDYNYYNGTQSNFTMVFPNYIKVVSTIACTAVLIVGVIGNLLVPLVIFKNKEMRNSTYYFLVNLSLADLLILIVCLPSSLVELHSPPETWQMGKVMCKYFLLRFL